MLNIVSNADNHIPLQTLAKVVDGWKDHETNLGLTIKELTQEKEKHKEDVVKLKEVKC